MILNKIFNNKIIKFNNQKVKYNKCEILKIKFNNKRRNENYFTFCYKQLYIFYNVKKIKKILFIFSNEKNYYKKLKLFLIKMLKNIFHIILKNIFEYFVYFLFKTCNYIVFFT